MYHHQANTYYRDLRLNTKKHQTIDLHGDVSLKSQALKLEGTNKYGCLLTNNR